MIDFTKRGGLDQTKQLNHTTFYLSVCTKQKRDRSCICMLGISILPISATVMHLLLFILFLYYFCYIALSIYHNSLNQTVVHYWLTTMEKEHVIEVVVPVVTTQHANLYSIAILLNNMIKVAIFQFHFWITHHLKSCSFFFLATARRKTCHYICMTSVRRL